VSDYRAITKKLGIPEEDAQLALSMLSSLLNGSEDEKVMSSVASAGEALSKAPQSVQQALTPVVASALIKQVTRDPFQEKLLSLAGGLMTIKTLLGGEDEKTKELREAVGQLAAKLEQLSNEIQELKASKQEAQQEAPDYITARLEELGRAIMELRERLSEASRREEAPAEGVAGYKNPVEKFKEDITTFMKLTEDMKSVLESLGYRVVKPASPEVISPELLEKSRKAFEALGFEVRPRVITEEEFRQRLRKAKKRLAKKYEEKLKRDRAIAEAKARQTESVAAVVIKLIDTIANVIAGGKGEVEFLKSLVGGEQEGGEAGGEGGGTVQQTQ
jgi:chromosome segregation ATPase